MSFAWFGEIGPVKTPGEIREFAEKCRELAANDTRATELMAAAWDKVADECEAAALKSKEPKDPEPA